MVLVGEVRIKRTSGETTNTPLREENEHPPVVVTTNGNVPDSKAVPLMVKTPAVKIGITPSGKSPEVIDAPNAPLPMV